MKGKCLGEVVRLREELARAKVESARADEMFEFLQRDNAALRKQLAEGCPLCRERLHELAYGAGVTKEAGQMAAREARQAKWNEENSVARWQRSKEIAEWCAKHSKAGLTAAEICQTLSRIAARREEVKQLAEDGFTVFEPSLGPSLQGRSMSAWFGPDGHMVRAQWVESGEDD